MRLIHGVAGSSRAWSDLVNKCLVLSQRPFDETRKVRETEWAQDLVPADIEVAGVPDEPEEMEEQLVRKLVTRASQCPTYGSSSFRTRLRPSPAICWTYWRHSSKWVARLKRGMRFGQRHSNRFGQALLVLLPRRGERPRLITLRKVAQLIGRSKRTLERYNLPPPTVPGGEGKAAYWYWHELRPWLEIKLRITLPDQLPDKTPPRPS